MERTLIVFKPDAVQRGIIGEVLLRFERAGLKIVGMKMVAPDKAHFEAHYEGISQLITRWGQEIFDTTLVQMTESPVVAVVLEGIHAVPYVRKMVGTTNPMDSPPGTIRGDYTNISQDFANSRRGTMPNILHASGNAEEAAKEIDLWFNKNELYDYKSPTQEMVTGRQVDEKDTK